MIADEDSRPSMPYEDGSTELVPQAVVPLSVHGRPHLCVRHRKVEQKGLQLISNSDCYREEWC